MMTMNTLTILLVPLLFPYGVRLCVSNLEVVTQPKHRAINDFKSLNT